MIRLTAGNACRTRISPRYTRRPGKDIREIAYAAIEHTVSSTAATTPAKISELTSGTRAGGRPPISSHRNRQFRGSGGFTGTSPCTRSNAPVRNNHRTPAAMGRLTSSRTSSTSRQRGGSTGISVDLNLRLGNERAEVEDAQVQQGNHNADDDEQGGHRGAQSELDIPEVVGQRQVIRVERPHRGGVEARAPTGEQQDVFK